MSQLYDHAKKDIGLSEIQGKKSHPRIKRAINLAADWLDDDDSKTAWCGCMLGLWCFELGLGVPKAHYRASSWLNWGKGVKDPQRGDVFVMERPGGNHVGIIDRVDDEFIWSLGGNQSNTVNIQKYNRNLVKGFRRA